MSEITSKVFEFKQGQTGHIDQIYDIQGLCGGDWWQKVDGDELGDAIIITRDIKITITCEQMTGAIQR